MKIISMPLQKGGTGKTSISVTLAVELTKKFKVLFIDCDTQGNSTGWILQKEFEHEFADYFLDGVSLQKIIVHSSIANLDVIGTFAKNGNLQNFKESTKLTNSPFLLADFFDDVKNNLNYDFCILDTSPNFSLFEQRLFTCCDEVIPPLTLENFSVDGLNIFFSNLSLAKKNMRSEKPLFNKIVINKIDKRYSRQKRYIDELEGIAEKFALYKIPIEPNFTKSQEEGKMVFDFASTKKDVLSEVSRLAADVARG